MSKGSDRRPLKVSEEAFADNWARIFGQSGRSSTAEQDSLTVSVVRSNRTAPATHELRIIDHLKSDEELEAYIKEVADLYIDDATGKQVSEHWWPGDDVK